MFKKIIFAIVSVLTLSQLTGCVTDAVSFLPKITTIEEAESYFGTEHSSIQLVNGTILNGWDNVGKPYYVEPVCQQVVTGQIPMGTDPGGNVIYQAVTEQQCSNGYWTKNECHIFVTTDREGNVLNTKATGNARGYCDGMLQRQIGD